MWILPCAESTHVTSQRYIQYIKADGGTSELGLTDLMPNVQTFQKNFLGCYSN